MSLIKETTSHVLAGDNVLIHGVSEQPKFSGFESMNGSKVITGALLPRAIGNHLILDNVTGEPLVLPSNIGLFQVYYVPIVPLESADLSSSYLEFYVYSDTSFTSSYTPAFDNPIVTAEEANSRAYIQIDDGEYLNSYIGFPYCGVYVGDEDITAGALQVYIYYYEAFTPILP